VTNTQLWIAIGVPLLFNATLTLFVWAALAAKLDAVKDAFNQRFDDMRELWRAELRRVEEVLDARHRHS
jgi:hypothetical protein